MKNFGEGELYRPEKGGVNGFLGSAMNFFTSPLLFSDYWAVDKSGGLCDTPPVLHRGDAIRKLRLAQGLTIPQLATAARLNPKTVSKIERRPIDVGADTLTQIAHALGKAHGDDFDRALDQWCHDRVGLAEIKPEWRALIEIFEALSHEAQTMMWLLMRREIRLAKIARAQARRLGTSEESGLTGKQPGALRPMNTTEGAPQASSASSDEPPLVSPLTENAEGDVAAPPLSGAGGAPGTHEILRPTGTERHLARKAGKDNRQKR